MEIKYYTVGQIAKLCDMPVRTLYYYDEIGLLVPVKKDKKTGYRYYADYQIGQINIINQYKVQGLSIQDMKERFEKRSLDVTKEALLEKRKEVHQNIQALLQIQNRLDQYLEAFSYQEQNVNMQIKHLDKCYIAFHREQNEATPAVFMQRFATLQKIVNQNKYIASDLHFAIYYDDYRYYNPKEADIEVALPVLNPKPGKEVRIFGGFDVISAMHYGSYEKESETYAMMMTWMEENNYVMSGPPIERFILDLLVCDKEEDYITELMIPIVKKS